MNKVRVREISPKETLVKMLDDLSVEQVTEVLDFAAFIKRRLRTNRLNSQLSVRAVPATHLDSLMGRVAWGGDALAETEDLYRGDQASCY